MDRVEFRILGQLEVLRGGFVPELGGHRQRALLAMLVIDANRVVSSDRLVDALWGETPPPAAWASLHAMVSRLRRALEPDRSPRAPPALLVTRPPGYCLRTTPESIDASRFEALARTGAAALAAGEPEHAAAVLGDALSLWRGPALADFASEAFASAETARLEELRLTVTEDRIEAALALGHHRAAVGDVEAMVGAHPLRERLWGQLMVALYRSGRQAEALRSYQRARAALQEELGLEPSSALRDLERAVLLQEPALEWVPPPRDAPVSGGRIPPKAQPPAEPTATVGGAHRESSPVVRTGTLTFLHLELDGLGGDDSGDSPTPADRRDEMVEGLVARHGGTMEAPGEGDTVLAVFSRASDGLAAALALARELALDRGPDGLRTRMALHSGEAVVRRGRYRGLAVSRGGRLRALAHPGQILLSQATSELVADHLPASASLRDLGTVRLSEVDRPEHVFQLCGPGIRLDFPPLTASGAPPQNLPVALTSFIGRGRDVADVRALIGERRLVTLVGAGGVGKTRLALEVAAGVVDAHPDGAWFVDFAPLDDPALVPKLLAAALRVAEESRRELAETIADRLRARRLLLVMDNCEHLIAPCAALAERLLGACPGVHILATSREPLGAAGEVVWRVPSLEVPRDPGERSLEAVLECESARLLLERAVAARPDLCVGKEDGPAVATICVRLDGIPLALELAAARTPVLTFPEIADRLDDRFRLLTAGRRTAMPRHQTLQAAVDWSYGLLAPSEQKLLQRLSVFAGGFTLRAAEAICSGGPVEGPSVLDMLASLAMKSLVLVDDRAGGERYRLLETIRQYARERLAQAGAEEEANDLARRHRDWYLAIAEAAEEEFFGAPEAGWALDRLEADHDNFRAALHWSLRQQEVDEGALRLAHALYPLWEVRNHRLEGRRWLEALVTSAHDETGLASAVARRAGNLALETGDGEGATALYGRALDTARRSGDRRHLARALTSLGNITGLRGDLASARSLLEEGLSLAREVGDQLFVAEALLFLAWVARFEASYGRARALIREYQATGTTWWNRVRSIWLLGLVERDMGDYSAARRWLEECHALAAAQGAQITRADALSALGSVAAAEGRPAEARVAYEASLACTREPRQGFLVGPLGGLGELAAAEGDHEAARALLAKELEMARQEGQAFDLAHTLYRVGAAAAARGDRDAARSAYGEAVTLSHAAGMPWPLAASLEGLAALGATGDDAERAARLLGAAEALREAVGAPLAPAARPARERTIAVASARLGDALFESAREEGRAAALDDAVAFALGGPHRQAAASGVRADKRDRP